MYWQQYRTLLSSCTHAVYFSFIWPNGPLTKTRLWTKEGNPFNTIMALTNLLLKSLFTALKKIIQKKKNESHQSWNKKVIIPDDYNRSRSKYFQCLVSRSCYVQTTDDYRVHYLSQYTSPEKAPLTPKLNIQRFFFNKDKSHFCAF